MVIIITPWASRFFFNTFFLRNETTRSETTFKDAKHKRKNIDLDV